MPDPTPTYAPLLRDVIQQAMDDFRRENDPAAETGSAMAETIEKAIERVFWTAPDDGEVWIKKSAYDAAVRAYEMTVEALDVTAMDGPGEVTVNQLAAMSRIVARSARAIFEEGNPHVWR